MYRVYFDGVCLFKRFEDLETARNTLLTSKECRVGKVCDLKGNIVFSMDRNHTNGKKEKTLSSGGN